MPRSSGGEISEILYKTSAPLARTNTTSPNVDRNGKVQ